MILRSNETRGAPDLPTAPASHNGACLGLSPVDLASFQEGTHCRLYQKLGAHRTEQEGVSGVLFSVWAPNAQQVFVMGDFNAWNQASHRLSASGNSGIWSGFIPGVGRGAVYKYHIVSRQAGVRLNKADPFAIRSEVPPQTASLVWDLNYVWGDAQWMQSRGERQRLTSPISIYEVHLGSWMRVHSENNRWLAYPELAPRLAAYAEQHNFTHVEFLPVMEHPFYGSWGYQITGYFTPTARYGTPQDLMFLIDTLHRRGIGVILDWVPSHFPNDEHGLARFDGAPLYEYPDPRQGLHPDWNSLIFNYGRPEVRSFLLSNAIFWLDQYHADGLRLDAVASMLYLDYHRQPGAWVPNQFGGRENLDAIALLRDLNQAVYREFPSAQTYAEESTAWPLVSRPVYVGGLGFGFKWDMGWMHDTLEYLSHDPIYRKFHHNKLTLRRMYAFAENYALPLTHDEVVHGQGSLLGKMPGDTWQKFATLRLLLAYQWAQPGKKLLFMGGEFGQWNEWNHDANLDWHLIQEGNPHNGLQKLTGYLNWLYRQEPALYEGDASPDGFDWENANDSEQSTLSFFRISENTGDVILAAFNFTPVPRHNTRVGVPRGGFWREILNTDGLEYGGSGQGNQGGVEAVPFGWHTKPHSLHITLPPLGAVFFKPQQMSPS